jgi:hypothetical protein
MLARRPEHRYPDWTSLVEDIDRVLGGGVPSLPALSRERTVLNRGDAGAAAKPQGQPAGMNPAPAGAERQPVSEATTTAPASNHGLRLAIVAITGIVFLSALAMVLVLIQKQSRTAGAKPDLPTKKASSAPVPDQGP